MKVLLFGTFDILHPGHTYLFKQARAVAKTILRAKRPPATLCVAMRAGSNLTFPHQSIQIIAVIARDATVKKVKKHLPFNNEKTRQKNLRQTNWADKVYLGGVGDRYEIIKKIKPDVICLGYDQKIFTNRLRQKIKQFGLNTKIVRLKSYYPRLFKSSKLKNYD